MRVCENQAFSCELVEVGRGDSAIAVENADIAITHVISEDDQDVRAERLLTRRCRNVFLCRGKSQRQPAGQCKIIQSHRVNEHPALH